MEEKFPYIVLHYCTDHNLQLTMQKAYSGDVAIRLGGIANGRENEEGDVVKTLKKTRDLVSHVNQSPLANAKLADAQKLVSPQASVLVLIQDVKMRWWSTLSPFINEKLLSMLKITLCRIMKELPLQPILYQ